MMTLHCDIGVNGVSIGDVFIQRMSPPNPRPETVCSYRWEVRRGDVVRRGFNVRHRFGDGPFALIAKVLVIATKAMPLDQLVPPPRAQTTCPSMNTHAPKHADTERIQSP